MQWSLFLLTLMGQCSFLACRLYEYHFIEENKTWSEAQRYCKEHYTDLATVFNETDVERLLNTTLDNGGAWIGLHSIYKKNIDKWQWSLPGVEYNNERNQWKKGQPKDHGSNPENCVWMKKDEWEDAECDETHKFICYKNEIKGETFHFIHNEQSTWQDAQSYCRERYTDLVSGHEQLNNTQFKKVLSDKQADNEELWIGLFRDMWQWSDGSESSFRNKLQSFNNNGMKCATTESDGEWESNDCQERKPFFCYDDRSSDRSNDNGQSVSGTTTNTPASTEESNCSMTDNMILIKENMTWVDALYYCRDNHTDLVFITDHHLQKCVKRKASEANSRYVWTGLRYTCTLDFWFWVSDELVIYKNWASPVLKDECDMSGAMDREQEHKWVKKFNSEEFNFICFESNASTQCEVNSVLAGI